MKKREISLGKTNSEPCPNCKETIKQCACMRNICNKCGKSVGNITFTVCDECWGEQRKCVWCGNPNIFNGLKQII